MDESREKVSRVLGLYNKLTNGVLISKSEEAARYHVSEKSIQRDIDDIRAFLAETEDNGGVINDVVYDRAKKGYRLEQLYNSKLTNPEILAICKILLDSRGLRKDEMDVILKKVVDCCVPAGNRKVVDELISNEKFHYIQPKHGKHVMDALWDIGNAVREHRIVRFEYRGVRGHNMKQREVEPVAVLFAGFYFYMLGFIRSLDKTAIYGDSAEPIPTIYRIDRLENLVITDERFKVRYKDRFEEGEFRKRVQFMYAGPLRKVKFKYRGYSLETVEDRLPTAKVVETLKEEVNGEEREVYVVEAEVYGDGIDQWFRQQGEMVEEIKEKC